MKYWGYFIGKVMAIAAVVALLNFGVVEMFGRPQITRFQRDSSLFLQDMPYTFCVLAVWLITVGLMSLAIRDQRQRCRTCLRRLIMPVASGSWANILTIGRPQTEWICPFGHGTLRIDELQITGKEPPDWRRHDDDIWKELESYGAQK
jgi:hypothetical protein